MQMISTCAHHLHRCQLNVIAQHKIIFELLRNDSFYYFYVLSSSLVIIFLSIILIIKSRKSISYNLARKFDS